MSEISCHREISPSCMNIAYFRNYFCFHYVNYFVDDISFYKFLLLTGLFRLKSMFPSLLFLVSKKKSSCCDRQIVIVFIFFFNFNVAHCSKSIKGINTKLGIHAHHDKGQMQDKGHNSESYRYFWSYAPFCVT